MKKKPEIENLKMINCKVEIRYICKRYAQRDCPFFKSLGGKTISSCQYGFPDRNCLNTEAKKEALKNYLKTLQELKK